MEPDLLNAASSYYMILRGLFFRLVVSLQIESSLSMEIIAFWLWIQGNGYDDYLACSDLFDDNYFLMFASTGKIFVEVLHIEFDDSDLRSIPSRSFLREAIEGISFYLNNICYKALEDLRERAEIHAMNQAYGESFFEQQAYGESFFEKQAYGESFFEQQAYEEYLNNRVPISPGHLLTKIKSLYTNTSKHHGEGTSSRSIHHPTSHVLQDIGEEVYERQSTSRLATMLENLSLREKHNDGIMQQLSDVPHDERTLFVTFSNGYPLTKDELYDFFMRHYGDIEEITIEEPMEQRPPLYAHVTFFSQLTLFRVLDGNKKVKFMTRQKHLWARQYVPKKKKTKANELNPFA